MAKKPADSEIVGVAIVSVSPGTSSSFICMMALVAFRLPAPALMVTGISISGILSCTKLTVMLTDVAPAGMVTEDGNGKRA